MAFRNRSRAEGTFQLNLTPLLDVVLQLITFFMILVHFGTKIEGETASIRLPSAPSALPGGELGLDQLVVGVDAKGRLISGGSAYEGESARAWWADQARVRLAGLAALGRRAAELPTMVIVRADKDAPFGSIRALLASAQELGFARFSLVILKGRNP